jgi:hypothetical protein
MTRPRILLALLLAATTPPAAAQDKTAPAPDPKPDGVRAERYYPLQVGTKWTYSSGGNQFTTEVVKHEKVNDLVCAKVEASAGGTVVATEHIHVAPDGVFRLQINGLKPEKPFPVMKLPVKDGETWQVDTKVGNETIKGNFNSKKTTLKLGETEYKDVLELLGTVNVNEQPIKFGFWFAPDVGMVKQTISGNGIDLDVELKQVVFPK